MLLLISWLAHAATFTAELPVEQPQPVLRGADAVVRHLLLYEDVALGQPDVIVPSDWPYVRCRVTDGNVAVDFAAKVSAWPTVWPATATCAAGGHTLTIDIEPAFSSANYRTHIDSAAAGATVVSSPGGIVGRIFTLDSSLDVVAGNGVALRSGTAWTGVACEVRSDGTLFVDFGSSSTPGNGVCRVQTLGGTVDIALELVH